MNTSQFSKSGQSTEPWSLHEDKLKPKLMMLFHINSSVFLFWFTSSWPHFLGIGLLISILFLIYWWCSCLCGSIAVFWKIDHSCVVFDFVWTFVFGVLCYFNWQYWPHSGLFSAPVISQLVKVYPTKYSSHNRGDLDSLFQIEWKWTKI